MDNRKSISPNEDKSLIAEVGGFCPICGDDLFTEKNGRRYRNYEIAHIYPCNATEEEKRILDGCELLSQDTEDDENKIALCVKCHTKIDCLRTLEEYNNLVNIKKELIKKTSSRQIMNEVKLQDDILEIIKNLIGSLSTVKKANLNYEAVTVDRKINDDLLCQKIKTNVASYYKYIDNYIKEFQLNNNKYDLLLLGFKNAYLNFSLQEDNQQVIFDNMVSWLMQKSKNDSRVANEIVVSYFVQHCEVFNDISK